MSLARQIVELRVALEKEGENPDQYYQRVGKCPIGFVFDGSSCVKSGTQSEPKKPATVEPQGDKGKSEPEGPEKPATVEPDQVSTELPKPPKNLGDLIRAPKDSGGWTKGDHMEVAQEFMEIQDESKLNQAVHGAATWLQKKWEGARADVADKLDNLSQLVSAYTGKRNALEDKAADQLEQSPEEYAKKLREVVPPETVKDTEEAIDSFADEKDKGKKKRKKKKVQDYAEQSAHGLIFGLLALAFAPIAAIGFTAKWLAKKVGKNIFGKKGEASGDVVRNLDELDIMIVQETIALLREGTTADDMEAAVQLHLDSEDAPKEERLVRLTQQIAELRRFMEKEGENPDQYRSRVGKCPVGFHWDGARCVKGSAPAAGQTPQDAPAAAPGGQPDQPAPKAAEPKGFFAKAKAFALKKLEQAKTDAKTIAAATKEWGDNAKNFVANAPHATKAFFTDETYRRSALMAGHAALTQAPGKIAKKAVATAKHEVEEFKMAGGALKTLAQKKSWKALSDEQKHALKTVTKHLALTIGAAAATASGVGIATGTAKGLARHIAAKTAGNVFAKLHTAEELVHFSHLFHDAQGDAEGEAAIDLVAKLVEKEIAAMFKAGIDPKNLETIADRAAAAEPRQESYVLPAARPLNCSGMLNEWCMKEATQIRRWVDVGAGVQGAYNRFAVSYGKHLTLDEPQGDITSNGVVDAGFGWELRKNVAKSETGDRDAKIGGEAGFKLKEMGNSVIVDAESRAWGSNRIGGVDARPEKKSYRGKSRAEATEKMFRWVDRVIGDQWAEVVNNLYDLSSQGPY